MALVVAAAILVRIVPHPVPRKLAVFAGRMFLIPLAGLVPKDTRAAEIA
jgi:hypothetical protein